MRGAAQPRASKAGHRAQLAQCPVRGEKGDGPLGLKDLEGLLGAVLGERDDERRLDRVTGTLVGDGARDALDSARGDAVDHGPPRDRPPRLR